MPGLDALRQRLTDPNILAILAVAAIATFLGLLAILIAGRAQQPYSYDFVLIYASGLKFFLGSDVYEIIPLDFLGPVPESVANSSGEMRANLNPPLMVLLLAPLSKLPYEYALWVWSLLSFLSSVLICWLLANSYVSGADRIRWSIGILFLLYSFSPTWIVFYIGQITFPLFLLLILGWRAARSGNERGAGIILGTSLALKPFVGIFLLFFLAYRRWRLIAWFLSSFLILNLVALTLMGPDTFTSYFATLKGVDWQAEDLNVSLLGFLTRLSGSSGGQPLREGFQWLHTAGVLASLLLAASVALLVSWLPHWPSQRGVDIGFSYSIVLMLILSPLGWVYYLPMLLLCVIVVFRESRLLAAGYRFRVVVGTLWSIGAVLYFLFIGKVIPAAIDPVFRMSDTYLSILLMLAGTILLLARSLVPKRGDADDAGMRASGPASDKN